MADVDHGPDDSLPSTPGRLVHKVMETDEPVEKGSVFEEIVRRFGNADTYEPGQMIMMPGMKM